MEKRKKETRNKTGERMERALIEMVQHEGYEKITISKLCKSAGVNRSTFYAHYENLNDLIGETMRHIIQNFLEDAPELNRLSIEEERNNLEPDSCLMRRETLLPYLEYIYRHRTLYLMYIRNQSVFNSGDMYGEYLKRQMFIPIFRNLGIRDETVIGYVVGYYLAGITSVILEWVEHGCLEPCEEIVSVIEMCVKMKFT